MKTNYILTAVFVAAIMLTACEKDKVMTPNKSGITKTTETKTINTNTDKSLTYSPLGNASISATPLGFDVSNIGNSGNDGVEFNIDSTCSLDLSFDTIPLSNEGDFFAVSYYANNGLIHPMLKLKRENNKNNIILSTNDNFQEDTLKFKILDGSVEKYSKLYTHDKTWQRVLLFILENCSDAHLQITFYTNGDVTYVSISGTISFGIASDPTDGGDFNLPNGNVIHGDRAEFVANYKQSKISNPKFRLQGKGIGNINVTSLNEVTGCTN